MCVHVFEEIGVCVCLYINVHVARFVFCVYYEWLGECLCLIWVQFAGVCLCLCRYVYVHKYDMQGCVCVQIYVCA